MIGLRLENLDGVPVAHLPADVDAANASGLREELIAFIGNDALDLVLALDQTRFLDSAGIDMLFRLGQRLADRRARVRLVIPAASHLRRLAEIVGLERALPLHETILDAVAAAGTAVQAPPTQETGEAGSPPTADNGCRSPR